MAPSNSRSGRRKPDLITNFAESDISRIVAQFAIEGQVLHVVAQGDLIGCQWIPCRSYCALPRLTLCKGDPVLKLRNRAWVALQCLTIVNARNDSPDSLPCPS